MANKSKNNKNVIIGVCAAVVILIIIIIAIVLGTRNGGFGGINDSYFVSDDTKYVLTIDSDETATDSEEYVPLKTHLVYTYSGDEITGLKAYYEYADADAAKAAAEYFQANNEESAYKSIANDGKYVILEANESEYEGVTASDVKQQIEFMEMLKNMNLSDDTEDGTEDDTTEEVVEEVVEE